MSRGVPAGSKTVALLVFSCFYVACGKGASGRAAGADAGSCVARACGEDCGRPPDGCGGALDCGACEVDLGAPVAVGAPGIERREPAVAIDGAGRIFVALMEAFTTAPPAGRDPQDGFRTRWTVSEDGGATYAPFADVSAGEMPYSGDPSLVVDSGDGVFLSFIDAYDSEPPRTVWLARLDAPGAPTRVDDGGERVDREFAAVGADDAIHVTWVEGFHDPTRTLRMSTSTDRGASFAPSETIPTPPATPPFFGAIAADPSGRLLVAAPTGEGGDYARFDCSIPLFLQILAASSDSGPEGLSALSPLPGQSALEAPTVACDCSVDPGNCPDIYGYAWPDVALAPDGASIAVWSRQEPGDPDGARVVLARGAGGAFGDPVPIDGLDAPSPSALFPAVAIDERGVIHAFWLDLRDGFDAGWGVFYVHSDDGGATFSAPTRLSEDFGGTASTIGDVNDVAAKDGVVALAWTERRDAESQVYVAVGRESRR
jgi:hypothetical protein